MNLFLVLCATLLLVVHSRSNPLVEKSSEEDNDIIVLSKTSFFKDEFIKYRGNHTITNLVVAYNGTLFDEDDNDDDDDSEAVLFFNQVDFQPNGEKVELGQFILVNGTAQKIFDGTCSTTDFGQSEVYFGAKDGLYVYNEKSKGADKLGTIVDSIVQLQITNGTKEIYILTEPDYRIYKVNREGTQKTLVEAIPSAKAFVLDRKNNIYYYGENKIPHVLGVGSTKPIEFTSFAHIETPILARPPVPVSSGAVFVNGEDIYMLKPDGIKELASFKMAANPTSVSVDAALIQYYAMDNNIYELNLIEIMLKSIFGGMQNILNNLRNKVAPYIEQTSNNDI